MSTTFPLTKVFPKVGIRPTIDGRRHGVRESLEEQTMGMAKLAAQLISSKLRYINGQPVECVIADSTIGGVAEATACKEKFDRENVGVILSVTPCWCYGGETISMESKLPQAIWGFNGTERPGAVYLACALAAHSQKGIPAFGIYGRDVQDANDTDIPADVEAKILQFVRAGVALATIKGKSYLSMGNVSMGIAGSIVNHDFLEEYLGMRVECKDMSEFLRRIDKKIYDEEEYEKALAWVKVNCKEGKDYNSPEYTRSREHLDAEWETSVKMALIARDMMVGNPKLAEKGFYEEAFGNHAILSGFQGQRQWTDYQPNGDFMESILNSSFDWNGIHEPRVVATENDSLNGVAMLLNYVLTNRAQIFSDVRTFWSPESVKRVTGYQLEGAAANGIIHLINSGATSLDGTGRQTENGKPVMKPFWEISEAEAQACLDATRWCPSVTEYFCGGGWSSCFKTTGGMPVTMVRVNLIKGLGPVLQLAEGYTVELPDKVHDVLDQRTNPSWPTTWFAPILTGKGAFTDVYSVMNNWGANHGAISYGHVGADLITLCSMLRIPVYMHNVAAERIFRPSTWAAFGTSDLEGADFRACKNFGPLYK